MVRLFRRSLVRTCVFPILTINGQAILRQVITKPTTTIDVSNLRSGVKAVKDAGEKGVQVRGSERNKVATKTLAKMGHPILDTDRDFRRSFEETEGHN